MTKMKQIIYEKEIWAKKNKEFSPALLKLLTSNDCLIILNHGNPPYKATLGVPHQAAIGVPRICENSKNGKSRPSDENAASYALVTFSILKDHEIPCKAVIVAHSTTADPNKEEDSPYCEEVFRDHTEFLIECHGAKDKRVLDLELALAKTSWQMP